MSQTKQKPKEGGTNTKMGNFVSFDTEIVDNDVPVDGKGLGKGERPVVKYENRQSRWSGLSWSTKGERQWVQREEQWKKRAITNYAQPLNVEMRSIAISKAAGSFARIRA